MIPVLSVEWNLSQTHLVPVCGLIYTCFLLLVSMRCMVSQDDYLNNLRTTLNLKLTLVQRLGWGLSAKGQSALLQTCLSIISHSPSHFPKQTHVCSPIICYSSLSVIGAYNYSVHYRIRYTASQHNNIYLYCNYHVGAVSKLSSFALLAN